MGGFFVGAIKMRTAVLIDGGHLREVARQFRYNPDSIEKIAHGLVLEDEELIRIFYYDCDPFNGEVELPVSGEKRTFDKKGWLDILAAKNLFAVRKGVLKFRGFKPRNIPIAGKELTDKDFKPDFEQKGVDMRIGLDIASLSLSRLVDRIILVTADTDCVPALKHGRIAGLQIVIVQFPGRNLPRELKWHADYCRDINWPNDLEPYNIEDDRS